MWDSRSQDEVLRDEDKQEQEEAPAAPQPSRASTCTQSVKQQRLVSANVAYSSFNAIIYKYGCKSEVFKDK